MKIELKEITVKELTEGHQDNNEAGVVGDGVARMIEAFRSFIGNNQLMAYLAMIAVRLKELHRVPKLKQTS